MPGVACELLDDVQQHPSHRPVRIFVHRLKVIGYDNRGVKVGLGEYLERLGVLRTVRGQQTIEAIAERHPGESALMPSRTGDRRAKLCEIAAAASVLPQVQAL